MAQPFRLADQYTQRPRCRSHLQRIVVGVHALGERDAEAGDALPHQPLGDLGRATLARLARALSVTIEALVDEEAPSAPSKRGPVSRLQQQLERIQRLPKADQRVVSTVLDAVLAQHGSRPGQEAATMA